MTDEPEPKTGVAQAIEKGGKGGTIPPKEVYEKIIL
jgi:hypothetical protein